MVEAVLDVVPRARVGHVGLQRDEETAVASQYYAKFPNTLAQSVVFLVDPMLATGGSAVAAIELLERLGAHDIRLIPVRHVAAGVHMAEGLYKTTGAVAAVLGNPGPGSAKLIPGVISARHEGVPVVVITAQHRLGVVYPSLPSTFQGQDQLDGFRPAVKWGAPIFDWSRIPEVVPAAFREMWCGRPGPVHLEIPAPVLYAMGDEANARLLPPASYRIAPLRPNAEQIGEAVAMIRPASS